MKLEITASGTGPERTLSVKGDVDMDSSPELRDEIKRQLKGIATLRLNLNGVGYIDSSGIAVLIQGQRWALKSKIEFRLVDPSPQVKGVIDLSQLSSFFTVETGGA